MQDQTDPVTDGPKTTILLVDDDRSILEAVEDLLELQGYDVITAQDGAQALDRMGGIFPDLIISDITMPGVDGYQFFEAVRRNPEWLSIPFIFLTARGQKTDMIKGYSLGVDDYVVKPFEVDELLIKVNGRLRRSRELHRVAEVEADKVKQQLVTVFSHELRTPLTYIYGYSTLLHEDRKNLDDEIVEQMLNGVRWGAERMVRLVEDLMLVVRLDSNMVIMEIERKTTDVDLSVPLTSAVKTVAEIAKARQISVNVSKSNNLKVRALTAYLETVIIRLLENAIHFSPEGATVEVAVESSGSMALVHITDQGVGIDPVYHEKIFERFFQVDRRRMEQQGTGVGLAIAREITRCHGGDITVESEPEKGSRFTIHWPLSPASISD